MDESLFWTCADRACPGIRPCMAKVPDQVWLPSDSAPRFCTSSNAPVPTSTTRPATMRDAGDASASVAPFSVASIRKCAAVSKVT